MMNTRKRALRGLGLSLVAVLGLMGLMAGPAQANWLINGTSFHGTESVEVRDHIDITLLVPAKNLKIQCHATADNGVFITGLTLMIGTLESSVCLAFQMSPLVRVKNCDPINQPLQFQFKAHLILHNGKNYLLVEPVEGLGGLFLEKEFSELCALTETSEVWGSVVLECGHLNGSGAFVGLDCGNNQLTQLLREAPNQSTLFGDGLIFGENAMTMDGILAMTLSGIKAHKPWGGHI